MYKYRPNDDKLTFICAGQVISRHPGGIVEIDHHANIVENHSAESLFSTDHLFKDHHFAYFEFDGLSLSSFRLSSIIFMKS